MTITFAKTRWLLSCLIISVLVHILFFYAWKISGTYNFAGPVTLSQTVDIDLTKPAESAAPEEDAGEQEDRDTDQLEEEPALKESPANNEEKEADSPSVTKETPVKSADALSKPATPVSTVTPLSEISGFLGTKSEKLTYLVSMFGIPVGSAVLESKNENGEISPLASHHSLIAINLFLVKTQEMYVRSGFSISNPATFPCDFSNAEIFISARFGNRGPRLLLSRYLLSTSISFILMNLTTKQSLLFCHTLSSP